MRSVKRASVLAFALLLLSILAAGQAGNAGEQLKNIRAKMRAARTAGDWRANLTAAQEHKAFLNESPNSLLEVSRAQVHLGDLDGALKEIEHFAQMGQSIDLLAASSDFAPLVKSPDFAKIQNLLNENQKPVSRAATAFQLTDASLLSEDIDYDSAAHRFFITSVREKKIVAVDDAGTAADFAKAPDNWPMLAVKVDHQHGRLWATEVAMQGFEIVDKSDWGKSAVLCYDLHSGKLLRRVEGPHGSALGDMTVMPNGDVIVSDGSGGGVYRLTATGAELERLDNGDFISPQTAAVHPDGKHIFVPDYLRGIGVLDPATKQVRWLSTEQKFALSGIDGLYFDRGKLIAVQNGTSPERVVIFTLDATLSKIESETVIERSTESLGDPTHGVVIGSDFFYIANSGWDITEDNGNLKAGAKPSSPRIMKAPVVSTQH
jgi:sugar lactone lactonase YvrE